MSSVPIEKYRPVLSASQIKHIGKLCRADSSPESLSVLGVMALYEYKISQGIIDPAYAAAPSQSLTESLGFSESKTTESQEPAQSDEALYQSWLENPDSLSIKALRRVQFYRYRNGKMMPEEERKYEEDTLGM